MKLIGDPWGEQHCINGSFSKRNENNRSLSEAQTYKIFKFVDMVAFDAPISISEFQNSFKACNFIGQNMKGTQYVVCVFSLGFSLKAIEQ